MQRDRAQHQRREVERRLETEHGPVHDVAVRRETRAGEPSERTANAEHAPRREKKAELRGEQRGHAEYLRPRDALESKLDAAQKC